MAKPKKPKSAIKTSVKAVQARPALSSSPRTLKPPTYRRFRLSKRIKHQGQPLSGGIRLFWGASKHIWTHKKVLLLVTLLYIFLTLVLVKGLNLGAEGATTKSFWQNLFSNGNKNLSSGFTFFGYLLGTANKTSTDVANLYQTVLMIIISLVYIWILRQTYGGKKPSFKDAFYKSQYPLIQFMIVLGALFLKFVPILISSALYVYIFGNGLAVSGAEKAIWISLFAVLSLFSLYMVTASVFALYIVTLPDVTPLQALRSARDLVRYRRWTVMRKVLFLPVALVLILLIIGFPVIILYTPAAQWVFFVLGMFGLLAVHAYLYGLYRELL